MENKLFDKIITGTLICLTLLIPSAINPLTAQNDKTAKKTAHEQAVRTLMESGLFIISVDRVNPSRGSSRLLLPYYQMKFEGNKITTYLPYFGRFYTAPIDASKLAIELNNNEITIVKREKPKKGFLWSFKVTTSENESLSFDVEVTYSGYASINVNSSSRESLSYSGELQLQ